MDTHITNGRYSSPRQSIRRIMMGMEIGQKVTWPIVQTTSVRVVASQTGLEMDRIYKTSTDRNSRLITVSRLS